MLLLWTIAASAGDVVKVGLIASYTGAFATWGSQFQQAVEAYQALHGNTVKGPGGEEIEIQFVYRDTASQGPDKAKQLAEELILHDRIKFLCGLELSPYAMALADISKEAKVPVVIMNAATASITNSSKTTVAGPSATTPAIAMQAGEAVRRAVDDGRPGERRRLGDR
jgi:branched-chain amino acid transport system substrate-binding protein